MRTAAAPLMWASAGPCMSKTPSEGRGFPGLLGLLSQPPSLRFLRGLRLKNTGRDKGCRANTLKRQFQ